MKDFIVIGGDSETVNGEPFSFQFFSKQLGHEIFIWCNGKTSTRKFLEYLDLLHDGTYVLFFHHLQFDAISLFYDRHIILAQEEFNLTVSGWKIEGIYANVVFAKLTKGRKTVHIIDTFAYFKTSLFKLSDIFCPELPKLNKPAGLGQKIFTKEDKEFCSYAMRDSEITCKVGEYIIKKHKDYKIPLSVSAPHFAANVFRHKYMEHDIPLPSKGKTFAALHSYHGGKNNVSVPFGWYQNVKLLDIISAYPAAMDELPSFGDVGLYRDISGEGHPEKELPRYGVYRISGKARDCKWPSLYDRTFHPLRGEFSNEWVTGPELNEALRSNEVTITDLYGYFYDHEKDDSPSPFKSYVQEFYAAKNLSDEKADKVSREFYKLLLNSLYGKFIQSKGDKAHLGYYYDIDKRNINRERLVIAGGLFHPFIATLITGIVRAHIHKLEHKYSALHTATDGIFTTARTFKGSKGLGGLKLEAEGDLLLFRNKLYILYGRKGKLQSRVFKNRSIIKYALHGFNGSVFDLERIYVSGDPTYEFQKVNKLKESLRRGLKVNDFVRKQGALNLETIDNGKDD